MVPWGGGTDSKKRTDAIGIYKILSLFFSVSDGFGARRSSNNHILHSYITSEPPTLVSIKLN